MDRICTLFQCQLLELTSDYLQVRSFPKSKLRFWALNVVVRTHRTSLDLEGTLQQRPANLQVGISV